MLHRTRKALGRSTNQFTAAVSEAIKCGYIHEYRNLSKPRHPKYIQLVDPFILFHYRFIDPPKGEAPRRWADFVADQGRFTNWRGNAFEIVCLYHVRQLKSALGIGDVKTREYPWASARKGGGAQIDLADGVINLCEMKFTDGPFELTGASEQKMIAQREAFREETHTKCTLKIVLVSANGVTGAHGGSIAKKLTLDDLFRD